MDGAGNWERTNVFIFRVEKAIAQERVPNESGYRISIPHYLFGGFVLVAAALLLGMYGVPAST